MLLGLNLPTSNSPWEEVFLFGVTRPLVCRSDGGLAWHFIFFAKHSLQAWFPRLAASLQLWGPGGPPLTAGAPQLGTTAAAAAGTARDPGTVAAAPPIFSGSSELGAGGNDNCGGGGGTGQGSAAVGAAGQLGLTAQQYAAAAAAAAAAAGAGEEEVGGAPEKRQPAERPLDAGQQLQAQQAAVQGGSQPRILLSDRVGLEVGVASCTGLS